MAESDRFKRGADTFEKVIGWRPPEGGPSWLKLTVENLFGDVWSREGLSIRDRRLITITRLLRQLGDDELAEAFLVDRAAWEKAVWQPTDRLISSQTNHKEP